MVFLIEGTLMNWDEIKPNIKHCKKQGTMQFIHQYKKYKDLQNCPFYWGDETEYTLLRFDHEKKSAQVVLNSTALLASPEVKAIKSSAWSPEYAEFMMEGKPMNPFGSSITDLNLTEEHFKERRRELKELLGPNETMISLSAFPRLGCANFCYPNYEADKNAKGLQQSVFIADKALCCQVTYFINLVENFTDRKQERACINVPIYEDKNTVMPYGEDMSVYGDNEQMKRSMKPGYIYMDTPTFGVGCCSLQITFQGANLKEAAYLYDSLTPISPIMLALSAAAPIHRGFLSNTDCRWCGLVQSCDDRTKQEYGLEPLTPGNRLVKKTRFDSTSSYLSVSHPFYNDFDFSYDEELYEVMKAEGVDEMMAKFVAQLLVRDPCTLYKEKIDQDVTDTDHIETIIGSNWHSIKLKLPTEDSGWKIEFRPMELQLTDFENTAHVVFMVLLTRALVIFKLNLLIPITKVDENFSTAQKPDAINKEKFHFRKNIEKESDCEPTDDIHTLMTLNEIINGKEGGEFPGLLPFIYKYLDIINYDASSRPQIMKYLQFVSDRASGNIMTMAQWTRQFVRNHEDYKHDSIVTERMTYDMMMECERIVNSEEGYQIFVKG